jgi:hypothetical protein
MRSSIEGAYKVAAFLLTIFLASCLASSFAWPAFAQDVTPAPTAPRATTARSKSLPLTGKERLGRKWMDEQRTDNCNVPIDKRGTKPRPSSCRHVPNAPSG